MAKIDAGVLPVGENDRLVGMITDRDIAVRAVAAGKSPDTPIREVMSTDDVCYCFEDQEISEVARREVLSAVVVRYRSARRADKGRILDELCATTGWQGGRKSQACSLGQQRAADRKDSSTASSSCRWSGGRRKSRGCWRTGETAGIRTPRPAWRRPRRLTSRRARSTSSSGRIPTLAGSRVLAHSGQQQVLLHGVLRREGAAQGAGQLHLPADDRPPRPSTTRSTRPSPAPPSPARPPRVPQPARTWSAS
jgi:hypothetical protein